GVGAGRGAGVDAGGRAGVDAGGRARVGLDGLLVTSSHHERERDSSQPSSTHVLHLLRRERLRIPEARILGNRSTIGDMDWYEPIFYACNYGVLLPWTLLIVAPRWRGTDWLVASALVPLVFGTGYAAVLFTDTAGSPD